MCSRSNCAPRLHRLSAAATGGLHGIGESGISAHSRRRLPLDGGVAGNGGAPRDRYRSQASNVRLGQMVVERAFGSMALPPRPEHGSPFRGCGAGSDRQHHRSTVWRM